MAARDTKENFEKALRTECDFYARKYGFEGSALDRGFEGYVAHLFAQEGGFDSVLDGKKPQEADLSSIILRRKDLGVDTVLEDEDNRRLLLIQSAFSGKNSPFPIAKVNDFFGVHQRLMGPAFVATGSDEAQALLANYGSKVRDGYSVEFRFVTNRALRPSGRRDTTLDAAQKALAAISPRLECSIYGQTRLKEFKRSLSAIRAGLLSEVKFSVQLNDAMEFHKPRHSLICRVSGNVLTNLYQEYRIALFALNIRLPMTIQQATNQEIRRTATDEPSEFFYYNNGVSAVCSIFTWNQERNEVTAERFQIINGAQTVGSIANTSDTANVSVLFRLTGTGEKSGGSFTENIIRFNNTQNPVRISDFRANDPIQKFLESELLRFSGGGPAPRFVYVAKRGSNKGARRPEHYI